MVAFLVDTSVLVYAYDPRDPHKQTQANTCLEYLEDARRGVLSTQVLGEFFWTVTRRLNPPLTSDDAERSITNYVRFWPVLEISSAAVLEAVRGAQRYQIAYWDALIWATAKVNNVLNVLSEDVPSPSQIEAVRFISPFAQGFEITSLG